MTPEQLLAAARLLAGEIQPVSEETRQARERILRAVETGDVDAVGRAVSEARVPYRVRRGKPCGVMTVDVMALADAWLAEHGGIRLEIAA